MGTNLIEVEFYGCKQVETARSAYLKFLNDGTRVEDAAWRDEKERLLAKVLSEMGKVIGINIDTLDIFKGGYVPKGWEHRTNRQNVAMEYINDLYEGRRIVPVAIIPPPKPPEPQPPAPERR